MKPFDWNRPESSPRLKLGRDPHNERIEVDLESFFEFSFWISEQLEMLVARHRPAHLPPPKVAANKRALKPSALSAICDN
jgi:hypothetical protein